MLDTNISINADRFILSSEEMDTFLAEDLKSIEPIAPARYWPGVAYTSAIGAGPSFSPEELENIRAGQKDYATSSSLVEAEGISVGILPSVKAPKASSTVTKEFIDSKGNTLSYREEASTVARNVADKILSDNKKLASKEADGFYKTKAIEAASKRVSRQLRLAERAKQITIVCADTGIVSQMDVPAIPYAALVWSSPFADLANCRGIAQQGPAFLKGLDTQVLAGVLITLAGSYDLFSFQPSDTGAQKNAILRSAFRDSIIDAIILIEDKIHSGNCTYLPKLSLILDSSVETTGIGIRLKNYVTLLAESIAKPDTTKWDSNALPANRPRPVFAKKAPSISFLAKQEQAAAEKALKDDKKAGKTFLIELSKKHEVTDKLKAVLVGMFEDLSVTYPPEFMDRIVDRLEIYNDPNATAIIKILTKDRSILEKDLSEIEASLAEAAEDEEEEIEESEEEEAEGTEDNAVGALDSDDLEDNSDDADDYTDFQDTEGDAFVEDMEAEAEAKEEIKTYTKADAPAGLTVIEAIKWAKKMNLALLENKPRNIVQSSLPSVAVYIPSAAKAHNAKE